jgi:hypothetical protein
MQGPSRLKLLLDYIVRSSTFEEENNVSNASPGVGLSPKSPATIKIVPPLRMDSKSTCGMVSIEASRGMAPSLFTYTETLHPNGMLVLRDSNWHVPCKRMSPPSRCSMLNCSHDLVCRSIAREAHISSSCPLPPTAAHPTLSMRRSSIHAGCILVILHVWSTFEKEY